MITITKNNPVIPTSKIYPFHIEGSWDQGIDCSLEDLERLKEEIEKIIEKDKH